MASVVVLGATGSVLATASVNVAFPTLTRDLDADLDTVQWVATGYLLGLAAVIPTTGWLSRRVGARRLYLGTLALFAAASVLCALAPTIEALIAGRVLQGLAGGATLPVGQMILATAAGPDRMGQVIGVVGAPLVLGPAIGPVLGGVLVEEFGWPSIFLMNVPLALASLALGWRVLPPMRDAPAAPFDRVGFVLVALGTPALVIGLAEAGRTASIAAPSALVPALVGTAALVAFTVHAWQAPRPLLDLRLWRNASFAACATAATVVAAGIFAMHMLLPLFFQNVRELDAAETGLMLAFQGLGTAIGLAIGGRLTTRAGGGLVALVGIVVMVGATVVFVVADAATPAWALAAGLAVRGLGMGASITPAMAAAYTTLRPSEISDATPQLNVVQRVGGAIGTAVLAVILARRLEALGGATDEHGAYTGTFAWAIGVTATAFVPAIALLVIERRRRR